MQLKYFLNALLITAPLFGNPLRLQLDPGATQVSFTLGDVLHTVHGTFRLKSGKLMIDPATGAAGGSLVVDATSGNSGSNARDSRMNKSILECQKYPEIRFEPDHVIGTVRLDGPSDVQLHGMFTVHGAAHEVTIPIHTEIVNGQLKARLEFPVPYVKWGMKNPSTFVLRVSDTVKIDVQAVGQLMPDNS